jgi:hypothetical protein
MAHFAEIDENNIVIRVLVTDNNDPNGDEGYQWLIDNLGGKWIKTSYNGNIRSKFAGAGDMYHEDLDVFISPKPFASWILNEETASWESPTPYPNNGITYSWDEETTSWQVAEFQEPVE